MKKTKLFQYGSMGSLLAGLFEGTLSIKELLKHGDIGIGTFTDLDGELIVLDGKAYQAREDGSFGFAKGDQTVPYSIVGTFEECKTLVLKNSVYSDTLKEMILSHLDSKNVFSMLKITGEFQHVHVRTVPKQEKPYPKLIDATKVQPEFNIEKCKGTIIGFYMPELYLGISGSGFHLHFINDDKNFGGHLLDFTLNYGNLQYQTIENIELHFPINNSDFMNNNFNYNNLKTEYSSAEE